MVLIVPCSQVMCFIVCQVANSLRAYRCHNNLALTLVAFRKQGFAHFYTTNIWRSFVKNGSPFFLLVLCTFAITGCGDAGVVVVSSDTAQPTDSTQNIQISEEISEVDTSTPNPGVELDENLTLEQSATPADSNVAADLTSPEESNVQVDPASSTDINSATDAIADSNEPAIVAPGSTVFTPTNSDITDTRGFFDQDGYDRFDVIRVDVRTNTQAGTCTPDDQTGCTLADVLNDTDRSDDFKVEIPIHVSADDFVDDGSAANAELRQRGGASRAAVQKSFRIKLDSKEVLWRNERRMQLNKHPYDRSRFRNKLSFDLMRDLPHLPSLRTQFVNLWVDDRAGPVDQGLYTHVEAAVKEYLVNREWDDDDNIYKAERFFFSPADLREMQLDEAGEPVDIDRFEARIEIKRGDDHSQLVNMLTALNDPSQRFSAVFERYFNRNNVLMWVATNFALGQKDISSHNFYLYNPKNSEKIYFLPWDYDGAFTVEAELRDSLDSDALRDRLAFGYARFADSVFMSGYLRESGAHQNITDAVDELRNSYLTDDLINYCVQQYAQLVRPYIARSPDLENLAGVRELQYINVYDESVAAMPGYIDSNIRSLKNDFGVPLPPFLKQPLIRESQVVLQWLPAFSMTGGSIAYDVQVSSTPQFEPDEIVATFNRVSNSIDLVQQGVDIDLLANGDWYFRVIARDDSDPARLWNIANNELQVGNELKYGIRTFSVP